VVNHFLRRGFGGMAGGVLSVEYKGVAQLIDVGPRMKRRIV
jgi:hypothetical protein